MYNLTSVVSSVDDNLGQPADGTCLTEHKPGNLAGTTHHRRSCWLKISMQSLNDCGEKALSPLWSVGGWENRTVARVARTGLAAKETAAKEHERCNRVVICAEVYSPLTKIVSVHLCSAGANRRYREIGRVGHCRCWKAGMGHTRPGMLATRSDLLPSSRAGPDWPSVTY